ncbi:type VII secretion target [Mycolicibacterium thermoresistibile]
MSPLQVTAHHLRGLASVQEDVVRGVFTAKSEVVDLGTKVETSHGSLCAGTAAAVKEAEMQRERASRLTQAQSEDLAVKLVSAADKYDEIDAQEKAALDSQMQPGS